MTQRIVKAGLCVLRAGKVLLARSEGDTLFQIPGGKIEPGESDVAALVREAREELAVEIDPTTARHLATFVAPAAGRPDTLVEVRLYHAAMDADPRASSEIAELHWTSPDAPDVACSDVVAQHILPYLATRDPLKDGPP